MNSITINESKRIIEVTKDFQKKASVFGSAEYLELREARHEFPSFKVVANKSVKRDSFKGLTYQYMRNYIVKHDDKEGTIMKEFMELRAKSDDAENAMASSMSYGEIRAWFFAKYPQIEQFHKTREERMQKIMETRKAKRTEEQREAKKLVA